MKTLWKTILIGLVFIASVILSAQTLSAQKTADVIYLKNGSIMKGVITEHIPNVSYTIETADGSKMIFSANEVEKITKETIERQKISPSGWRLPSEGDMIIGAFYTYWLYSEVNLDLHGCKGSFSYAISERVRFELGLYFTYKSEKEEYTGEGKGSWRKESERTFLPYLNAQFLFPLFNTGTNFYLTSGFGVINVKYKDEYNWKGKPDISTFSATEMTYNFGAGANIFLSNVFSITPEIGIKNIANSYGVLFPLTIGVGFRI